MVQFGLIMRRAVCVWCVSACVRVMTSGNTPGVSIRILQLLHQPVKLPLLLSCFQEKVDPVIYLFMYLFIYLFFRSHIGTFHKKTEKSTRQTQCAKVFLSGDGLKARRRKTDRCEKALSVINH